MDVTKPQWWLLLVLFSLGGTGIAFMALRAIAPQQIQAWVQTAGPGAPLLYIGLYVVATLLILPSTALNLAGGAVFGPWMGTLWTSVAALIAAVVAFMVARTIGRDWFARRLAGRWQALDAEIRLGGLFYMFAVRLLPLLPYGFVNFAAGLTAVTFKDYLLGTALGTVPGILPFVLLGSSGFTAVTTGNMLPLVVSLALIGLLVAGATWYRHRRLPPVSVKYPELPDGQRPAGGHRSPRS
jgi:uncharacterized membrane protein YdjX (TVP38/TMEM64 family)